MEIDGKKIYDVKLTFRKTRKGTRCVMINIRYSKRGNSRKEKLPFPQDINEKDLHWVGYRGERVAVYHRVGDNYKYKDMEHSIIPTALSQRLEGLVLQVHFKDSE